ncbi:hypothetical protein CSA37_03210 [Candidatus Fermentibacteria bacterium]|nr:MAG: hypothetical protein CSA37_03210 [Candidatus Fermentibacteria bacterium]
MITALIVLTLLLAPEETGENTERFRRGILVRGTGNADPESGLSTAEADTLHAFPVASYTDEHFSVEAAGVTDFIADSTGETFRPVSAGCSFTWPGSPWISAGVFYGLNQPFISGIGTPLSDWGEVDASDSTGMALKAGGILGFDGFWNQYGESLSWYGVHSPWLGFGQISWEKIDMDSTGTDFIRGFADLRSVQPWFLFEKSDSISTGEVQLRGWQPDVSSLFRLEIVPGVVWCDDSTTVSLSGLVSGRTAAVTGSAGVSASAENIDSATLFGRFYMLSREGIEWEFFGNLAGMEEFSGEISGLYSAAPAGFGGALNLEGDSLSLTATGIYSPVGHVTSKLSVTSDLNASSPDPCCELSISGGFRRGFANVSAAWDGEAAILELGVSAWID